MQSIVRWPMRSPATPKKGEKREPSHTSAATITSCCTDPVVERMYHPRMSASISNAHDVARSAGHWKRKLRTLNGDGICENCPNERRAVYASCIGARAPGRG